MQNIFTGVRVIDITKVFSGPFATRMLADYGAEVIKIESKKNYDDSRNYPPYKNGWSGYYEILNRNKKGIELDLKNAEQLEKLYSLVKEADVFVENLTPSTKHKLKVNYETLKKINSKIIYASLSGIGQQSDRKYYDVIAQAQSGLMSLSGYPDEPMKIGPSVVDAFSGMTLAFGISSALFYREKSGKGQYIDVSMLASAMNLLESNLIEYSVTRVNPTRSGRHDNTISPFGVYRAKDGFIVVAAGNENIWRSLSAFLREHIAFDEALFSTNLMRLKNNITLTGIIEKVLGTYKVSYLEEKFLNLGIPCSRVNEMSDVASDMDNFKNKSLILLTHPKLGKCIVPGMPITFSEGIHILPQKAPEIGENNVEYGL